MSTILRGSRLIENCTPSISYDRQVQSASAAFDNQCYEIIDDTGQVIMIPNIMGIDDENLIDILAWQFHVDFYDKSKPLDFRKQLVQLSIVWHKTKGTVQLVNDVLNMYYPNGVVHIEEWFKYRIPFPPQYPDTTDVLVFTFAPTDVNVATDTFTHTAHGLTNTSQIRFHNQVLSVGSKLPAPLVGGLGYWIVNATANTFQVALNEGGTPVAITDAGTGTNELWLITTGSSWHDRYRFRIIKDGTVVPDTEIPTIIALIARYKPISRWPEGETLASIPSLAQCFVCGYALEIIHNKSSAPPIRTPTIPT
jgi:phage tail P2-like protein